jgi:hypothetical protein
MVSVVKMPVDPWMTMSEDLRTRVEGFRISRGVLGLETLGVAHVQVHH